MLFVTHLLIDVCVWVRVYNGTVHGVNLLAKYLSSVHWCHAWHSCVVLVICVFIENQPASPDAVHLADREPRCHVPYSYLCNIPSATSYFETLKKNDWSLNKNYTVTRLEVAFLMIVWCASCFERGSSLKAPCGQLATECIIRQVMYWPIHSCSNVWNCVDPSKLPVEQLPSPERSIFLSSVCHEGKNLPFELICFIFRILVKVDIFWDELMTAFTICIKKG